MLKKLILVLLMLGVAGNCWAADIVQYVDTDVSGGTGDGSSWANAYSSLSAWEAQNLDLTDNGGDTMTVYCRGDAVDSTTLTIAGWTTSSSNTITIIGNNSTGKWDDSKYTFSHSAASDGIVVQVSHVRIRYLQFIKTNSVYTGIQFNGNGTTGIVLEKSLIQRAGSSGKAVEISNGAAVTVRNCIIFNDFSVGINANGNNDSTFAFNNTVNGGTTGIARASATQFYVVNNVVTDCDTCYSGTASTGSANNSASDTTTYGSNSQTEITSANNFTNAGSGDFTVKDTNANIYNTGADLSSYFTDDITGTTRSGTYDRGAFEYQASAPASGAQVIIVGGN